jgi:copper oxidase (laccase) domain-containing protein
MYQLPELAKVQGLAHGFSTRNEEGNQRYGPGNPKWCAIQNRATFIRKACPTIGTGFPFQVSVGITPFQKGFEEKVAIVSQADAGRGMTPGNSMPCEALVTDSPNLVFFIASADCAPGILYDRRKHVLALVHAGRESTIRRIPEKTLRVMREKFGTDSTDVVVGMGPGFRSHFLERLPARIANDSLWQMHCHSDGRRVFMNLFGYNRDCLMAAGVPDENIEECPFDTYERADLFFSCRRSRETGEPEGRHACAVGMLPKE